ncbi:LOW QUALITY PROTEIN: uncharacterized protein RBU47_004275 [Passerculus sandwichensis]
MPGINCTQATEFSLAGFTEDSATQVTLFLLFLLTYLVTILGNLGMITLIRASALLYSPMYYFLGNLAFVNLCTSTTITPRMLAGVLLGKKGITYAGCLVQIFTFGLFLVTECFLLAAMAYDRFVAICHPLLYPLVMSPERCSRLVTGSYLLGLTNGVGQAFGMSSLFFCSSSTIDLFFCDISMLISLSSSDTTLSLLILRTSSSLLGVPSLLVVLVSYVAIISSILSISSAEGKRKALSTCASHLAALSTFYGPLIFMYLIPRADTSRGGDKWAAVLYTVVTPMLNPWIYSLRNREVKEAWRRLRKIKLGHVQVVLFVVLLVLHVITLLGNAGLLVLIRLVAQLHTPMYFFLSSLSFLELCYSSCITPRLLRALLHEDKAISHTECLMQFYFYVAFATTECCLLAAMAYDRCVAICPPCSTLSMSRGLGCSGQHAKVSKPPDGVFGSSGHLEGCTEFRHRGICACLVAGSCLAGVTNAALHTGLALRLSFCGPIDHFYCEGPLLFALSCTDPAPNKLGMLLMAGFSLAATILAILLSYALSLAATILAILLSYALILALPWATGKREAFSTCASRLAAVALFHGSLVSMYCRRSSSSSRQPDKVASVFYTMGTPMLNPFIYSLRNQEGKARLWRLMGRKHSVKNRI